MARTQDGAPAALMMHGFLVALGLLVAFGQAEARAQDRAQMPVTTDMVTTDMAAMAALLARPAHAALMRHATAPGTGDPDHFRLDDCATQRNLSDQGRTEATATGRRLAAAGITTATVLTSRWCRATETARLLDLGPALPFPPLDSFFGDRGRADAAATAIRDRIAGRQADDPPLIMVSHQVNITAVTGIFPASGEIVVVEVTPDGGAIPLARIRP
ncbi:histidine phosphatase family protein [Tistrella bauzanensis]|uniref:histidine phosphatase family protein n=1 Tax=Tistrella TaxID=171436 RepID=UPI0031F6F938